MLDLSELHDRISDAIASGADVEAVFDAMLPKPEVSDRVDLFREPAKAALPINLTVNVAPPNVDIGPTFVEPPQVDIQNIVEPTPITVEGATVEVNPTPVTVTAPEVHVTQPDINVESPTVNVTTEKAETGEPLMAYVINWPEPPAVKVERGPDGRVTGARPE